MQLSKKIMDDDALPESLDDDIRKARSLAPPPPPPEDLIYPYLLACYRLLKKIGPSTPKKVAKLNKAADDLGRPRIKFNRAKLIIEQTAGDHVKTKMRGKYAAVLRYAELRNVKSKDFVKFVKGKGGINNCVEKYMKKKKQGGG